MIHPDVLNDIDDELKYWKFVTSDQAFFAENGEIKRAAEENHMQYLGINRLWSDASTEEEASLCYK